MPVGYITTITQIVAHHTMSGVLLPFVSVKKQFGTSEYEIQSFLLNDKLLRIELLDCSTQNEWHAELSLEYVEALTKKAGNFKRFETFVSMLHSSLLETLPTLRLEFVSYNDLELLRQHKLREVPSFARSDLTVSEKRYLILTYTTDFDRTHYPVPLVFAYALSSSQLRQLVKELRTEVAELKFGKQVLNFFHISLSAQQATDIHQNGLRKGNSQNGNLQVTRATEQSLFQVAHPHRPPAISTETGDAACVSTDLRTFVGELQKELFEAKSKASQQECRYRREVTQLRAELNASNACRRSLCRRIDHLTNELLAFKHGPSDNSKRKSSVVPCAGSARLSRYDSCSFVGPLSNGKVFPHRATSFNPSSPNLSRRTSSASPSLCRPKASPVCERFRHSLPSIRKAPPRNLVRPVSTDLPPNAHRGGVRTSSADPLLDGGIPTRRFDPAVRVRNRYHWREEAALKRHAERFRQQSSSSSQFSSRSVPCIESGPNISSRAFSGYRLRVSANPDESTLPYIPHSSNAFSPALSSSYESLHRQRPILHNGRSHVRNLHVRSPSSERDCGHHSRVSMAYRNKRTDRRMSHMMSSDDETISLDLLAKKPSLNHSNFERLYPTMMRSETVNSGAASCCRLKRSRSRDGEWDSDTGLQHVSERSFRDCGEKLKASNVASENRETELDEIDRRLNVLQDFFRKYLSVT